MSKRRTGFVRLGAGALVAATSGLFLLAAVAGAADHGAAARPAARPTEVTLPAASVPPSRPATTTASNAKDGEVFGTEMRVTLGVVVVAFAIAFFATRRRRAAARAEREAEERYEAGLDDLDDDDEPADPDDPGGAGDDEPVGV